MMFRGICFLTGAVILVATVHANIIAGDGYGTPVSYILLSIALGVAVGAIAIGHVWAQKRWLFVSALVLGLCSGELLTMMMTAERGVASREAAQAPARKALAVRKKAEGRFQIAQVATSALLVTSPRLTDALAAKATADRAVVEKSALRGCARNCRALLEQQVKTAAEEVLSARRDLTQQREVAQRELAAARAALAATPVPRSGTPFADRLGIEPWKLDLAAGLLLTLGANGLACTLLALAGHYHSVPRASGTPRSSKKMPQPVAANDVPALPAPRVSRYALDHVDRFAATTFQSNPRGAVRVVEALAAYRQWCDRNGEQPLADAVFADAFATLVENAGLKVTNANDPTINGIAIAPLIESNAACRFPAPSVELVGPVTS